MSAVLKAQEPSARYLAAVRPGLMEHFELVASAPGGVARLRDLILNLAVRGQLVRQDASDEPASRLLSCARAEKECLFEQAKGARSRSVEPVSGDEQPFKLPIGWAWARLPEICYDFGQQAPTSDFTYIDVGSIDNERACITDAVQVLRAQDAPSRARKLVEQGTVVYSTVRPYLKNIAIVERSYTPSPIASTAFAVLHPHTGVDGKYVLFYLRSDVFTQFVASKMVGVAYPAINDTNFFQGVIALPPAAEQARIVARVEELMRLCDALEAKNRLDDAQHAQLLNALLGMLTDSASPKELAANWQRVSAHFDILLDRPEAADALAETVLRLAVRGLLVLHKPQANTTEQHVPRPNRPQRPFSVPLGWSWSRLGDHVAMLNGYAFKSDWFKKDGIRLLRNVNVSHGHIDWSQAARLDDGAAHEFQEFALREGDIVLSLDRPIIMTGLKLAVVRATDLPCLLLQRVARLSPDLTSISPDFLVLWMLSDLFKETIDPGRSNGVPHISTKQVAAMEIALPPLAEQRRIVARVNQLHRLCADLREKLANGQTTQVRLADALVQSAASAD